MIGWAGQLSKINATFLFSDSKFLFKSHTHSSNKTPSIQLFFCALYLQGIVLMFTLVYTIKCPGCGEDYIGKTDRCVIKRLNEHSNRSDQPMIQHLKHCETFLETMTLYQLPDIDTDVSTVNLQAHIASAVSDNWKILDFNTNWAQLCFRGPGNKYVVDKYVVCVTKNN